MAFRHDQRSGFDRRASLPGDGVTRSLRRLHDSRFGLIAVLVAINALNLIDLLLTFNLLGSDVVEGNPVMRFLLGYHPLNAMFVKTAIVAAVTLAMWRLRRYRIVLATAILVLAAFVALTGWELWLLATT